MRRHSHRTLLRIVGFSTLLWGLAAAQSSPRPSPHLASVMGRPPAVVLPPQRSPYLPGMPYPYPRLYVHPIVPISPRLDSDTASHPPAEVRHGYLRLDVKPAAAAIYVDGHFIGHSKDFSGLAMVPVWPGGHRLDFRADGVGYQVRVFVAAGETVALSYDLSLMPSEKPTPTVRRWTTPPRRHAFP